MKKIIFTVLVTLPISMVFLSCSSNNSSDLKASKDTSFAPITQKDTIYSPITHADVERWLAAWNSHHIDSINALFAEDAMIYQPQNPKPLTKQTMNPFFEMVFKTYPDIKFEKEGITVEGYDAASWENVTGTMTGPFTDPATGKTIQPTGKRFEHKGAMHITYKPDHTIKEVHIVWDQLIVLKQLGLYCNE